MISLVKDTITKKDINNLIKWLKTYPRLTKGEKTLEFEKQFAKWIGTEHALFVNSGSSANLLMVYALKYAGLLPNNKVAVPTLSWATDLSPILQYDIEPVLVDCNLKNLSVDLKHLEKVFKEDKPDAFILVSVLGLSPDMGKIVELCEKYDVILLEDNCESQGTVYKGDKLGTFGLASSFSTFFGHIMSTIEGGVITTNDEGFYNLLLQLRSHGWDRDLPKSEQELLRTMYNVNNFEALYTFYVPGFNLRSTDLQAVIGIEQLKGIDKTIKKRNKNFKSYISKLKNYIWVPTPLKNTFTSSFCFPIIAESKEQRDRIVKSLTEHKIEVRPLICGSMGTQPFYTEKYDRNELPNAKKVDECGLYIPNHPYLTQDEINLICNCIIQEVI
jgi:CDP-6-deoxy-D-xylo-4-hexulose-3-dehydrase